ncbi:MAG: PEP-CTERM sorting domain-containing protein [bacterium]|nr:PEP-CTERM sorting domain-containing protein [bacterium]MDI1337409.1 PEP-CTERM sorting domain-containing protein [Lacunisphaera sp.]
MIIALPAFGGAVHAQVSIVSSYTENFDALGTALPAGWGVWTSSTATGNGTTFTWATAPIANNATAGATNYFRNLPGASQTWTSSLSTGTDRALGWRAGNAASRDGSVTFSLAHTAGYNLTSLSFQLFTPNSIGTAGTFQLQYQLGASGTFTQLASVSYTNDTAQNPLTVTTITLTSGQLTALNNQSGQVTLRWDNTATSGTAFYSLALDNFSYTATAIPEPSTYAAILGVVALAGVLSRRRKPRPAA